MEVSINRDGCISCGLCVQTCPEVFRLSEEDDLAEVYTEPQEEYAESIQAAADGCPVSVISVE